jgi:photosystem II stability/assembly factor-like uncharacterized protein
VAIANPLASERVLALAADPTNGEVIYAGTGDAGPFKTTDGGRTWVEINEGFTGTGISGLAVDPTAPQTVYGAARTSGLFKTIDGGASWSAIDQGIGSEEELFSVAIDPTDPQTLFAGANYTAFKSTDGGENWVEVGTGGLEFAGRILAMVVDPTDPQTVYAGAAVGSQSEFDGVYKSVDGGTTWAMANDGIAFRYEALALAMDPSDPATIYAAVGCLNNDDCPDGRIYKSTDGAGSWEDVLVADAYFSSVIVDPSAPETVYAGDYLQGVFLSSDGGAHWMTINQGLPETSIYSLVISASGEVYVGTNVGVFKYEE